MSPPSQERKADAFAALHRGEPFVIPNPWDAETARVLEALGFSALATTSSGFAFTLGRIDGGATLDELCGHIAELDRATGLPVSADLENGYAASSEQAAHAVPRAAEAGAVGASIEDWDPSGRIYDRDDAAERVAAAVEAARGFGFPFMLTARAENYLRDNLDLEDTIARLQAYEAAGADVDRTPLPSSQEIIPSHLCRRGVGCGPRVGCGRHLSRRRAAPRDGSAPSSRGASAACVMQMVKVALRLSAAMPRRGLEFVRS